MNCVNCGAFLTDMDSGLLSELRIQCSDSEKSGLPVKEFITIRAWKKQVSGTFQEQLNV